MPFTEDQIFIQELIKQNLITREKLIQIQDIAKESLVTQGITKTLIKFSKIDESKLAEIISEKFNIPLIENVNGLSPIKAHELENIELPEKFNFIPVIIDEREISIALIDPPYKKFLDFLARVTNRQVVPIVVKVSDFESLYKTYKKENHDATPLKIDFARIDVEKRGEKWAKEVETSGILPPANKVLEKIIETAINSNTSDIHFEIKNNGFFKVRFRLDGVLQKIVTLPGDYTSSIPQVIKQSGSVDSFNKKAIQEGHNFFTVNGKQVYTRINIIPTSFGEKITIRILKKHLDIIQLNELGLSLHDLNRLKQLLSYSNSVVLFVGPSGCGKTTTMYSALNELNHESINIATVENPIECLIEGINQTQVFPNKDYSFTEATRSLFHHDVDILCLGEIRHKEEAKILIEAGLTGMTAFSTIQAANAIKSLYRLQNLGIKTEELALVLRGIVAQKFVRKICPNCKVEYKPDNHELEQLGLINLPKDYTLKRGKGCQDCLGSGYLGRIPLFEILLINESLASLIHQGKSYNEIKVAAERYGFTTMRYDGLRKALAGITTLEEVIRVTA